jgi:hypothetical protein
MSGYARVESVDALRAFRQALIKFAETANVSLADAEGEMTRVLVWLETEQDTYWQSQIRKRHEDVERARDAVRQKKLYKSPAGNTQSAVEEEKMLKIAQRRLEEAEQKLKNVRRYVPRLQKELQNYKGGIQRLQGDVMTDIPLAVSRLDKMVGMLEMYAALSISGGGQIDEGGEIARSMARAVGELSKGVDYSPLRRKTASVDRAKAADADIRAEAWSDGLASPRERELIAAIKTDRHPPAPDAKIVIEQAAWQSTRIYLERIKVGREGEAPAEPGAAQDSGWFLGRADDQSTDPPPPVAALAIPVSQLTEVRPDLTEILALPTGYLAVIDMGGVTAILNEHGADIWSALSGQPAPSAQPAHGQSAPTAP